MFVHAKNFSHSTSRGYNSGVIMSAMASWVTGVSIIYSTVCSGADQTKKHQSFASLAFVMGIHRWSVNSPHEGSVTRKCFHLKTSPWNMHTVLLCLFYCGWAISSVPHDVCDQFDHIFHGCFTGTWAIMILPQYIRSNRGKYRQNCSQPNRNTTRQRADRLPLRVVISMFMNIFLQTHSLM